MAKPKSSKMRTLLTLHVLLKYTDAEHTINTNKLNEYLRPYGLDCTPRVLRDTVRLLREMGFDVRSCEKQDSQGVWLEDRLLPDCELMKLIFAVTTNPHLSRKEATETLRALKSFLPVYQEPLLQGYVETAQPAMNDNILCEVYSVIHEAITSGYWVRIKIRYTKFSCDTKSIERYHRCEILFTPRSIYQCNNNLYMIGYDNTDRRMDAINLRDIESIHLAAKHKGSKADIIDNYYLTGNTEDLLPARYQQVIYEGPAVFYCCGKCLDDLYCRFGPPNGPVKKDSKCRITYTVHSAVVTSETLFWLSQIPNHGIRILGPAPLKDAIKTYYRCLSETILK